MEDARSRLWASVLTQVILKTFEVFVLSKIWLAAQRLLAIFSMLGHLATKKARSARFTAFLL